MRPAILSVLLALVWWASSGTQAFTQERLTESVADKLYASVVRIVATRAEAPLQRRVASGFRWKDSIHVVTAMHVVLGAEAISIESFVDGLHSVQARVVKIYPASDLALLELAGSLPGMPLPEAAKSAEKGQSLWVVGFPLEVFSPRSRLLRLSEIAPAKLIDAVDRTAMNDLRSLGFPALDSEVLQVEGDLLHGDSGAPIVNAQGELVGIGNGGLKNGFAGLGWAIPASALSTIAQEPYADADLDATKLSVVQTYFFADPAGDTLDQILWETALQADRLEYYQDYLDRLPNGQFAAQAQQHVNELTARHNVALNYYRTAVESVSLGQVVEADTLIAAYQRSKHDLEQAISLFPEFAPAHLELGGVDGFDQDEAGSECDEGCEVSSGLLAA
jgi:S1-C subfamily serine protease